MSLHKKDFKRLHDYLWELPATHHADMRVPVWVYADDALLEDALGDESLQQAVNVACLPSLVGKVVVMPDVHQGYGMPIGGVMAAPLPSGIISPESSPRAGSKRCASSVPSRLQSRTPRSS